MKLKEFYEIYLLDFELAMESSGFGTKEASSDESAGFFRCVCGHTHNISAHCSLCEQSMECAGIWVYSEFVMTENQIRISTMSNASRADAGNICSAFWKK